MQNENESRKASAEAQVSKAPSEEDFVGLISYISEREKGLSRYSNKLRENLVKISDVFGSNYHCQICGDVEYHTVADKEARKHAEDDHAFKPKIFVSLEITDQETFLDETTDEDVGHALTVRNYLCLHGADGLLVVNVKKMDDGAYVSEKECDFTALGRGDLKALVKSGRLPKFLAYAASKIAEAEQEYQQVADVAEKMAKAIGDA